jgi:hypothetical protein
VLMPDDAQTRELQALLGEVGQSKRK